MTNPTPDTGHIYDDAEIEAELARWKPYRHFNGPIETIQWFATHTNALLAIVTQLRAERDAARAEAERLKRQIYEFNTAPSERDATFGRESEGE